MWAEAWELASSPEQAAFLRAKARERDEETDALCGLLRSQNHLLAPVAAATVEEPESGSHGQDGGSAAPEATSDFGWPEGDA